MNSETPQSKENNNKEKEIEKIENELEKEFILENNNNTNKEKGGNSMEDEYTDLAYNLKRKNSSLNSQHILKNKWNFWYTSRKEKDFEIPYSDRLKKIAEFSALEEFFKYYMFLKSPSDMERNTDLSIFKLGYKPLWESCPDGGCWFIRFKKTDDQNNVDLKWEKIVFALIDKNMLGSVLSIRTRETVIEVWFDYKKNENLKNIIGKKIKEILDLEITFTLYFKENSKSMQDKSTLKNAESYNLGYNHGHRKSTNQY